jgi:hypothetical protein
VTLRLLSLFTIATLWSCGSSRTPPQPATPESAGPPEHAAALSTEAEGPPKHRPAPTVPEITPRDLMTRLYIFADDSMLGREAGTEGNVRGTNYLAAEAQRIGLLPGGENGSFFQTVPMINRAADSSSTLTIDGTRLQLGQDFVPLPLYPSFLPYGSDLQAENPPAIFAGRLGDSLTASFLAQAAGKLVVFAPALGPDGKPVPSLYAKGTPPAVRGAAGAAFVTMDLVPKEQMEFLMAPQALVTTTVEETRQTPLGMLISPSVAERLFGAPLASLKPGTMGKPLRGRVKFTANPPAAPARNVVAILPGTDARLKGQYVAIGSHNDHLGVQKAGQAVDHDSLRLLNAVARPEGQNQPPKPLTSADSATVKRQLDSLRRVRPARADSIFNGADDDGSGSVAMLEMAEAMARDRPRRSILFVWHTAEEKGLYGSQWFTDHPTVPRDSIVTQLNMDMVGRGRKSDTERGGPNALGLVGSRRLSTELGDLIERLNNGRHPPFRLDYSYDANGHPDNVYCRSDHYMYARYGIPIAFFSSGIHRDYHMVTDEPQYIDYTRMSRIAGFIGDVARAVADQERRPVVDKPKPDPKAPCQQ